MQIWYFLGHTETINLDEGKIYKIKMFLANSLEWILFFLFEMNHLLVFSVHTSQSVLALSPPPLQFNVGLDSGLRVRPLQTLNGGGGWG